MDPKGPQAVIPLVLEKLDSCQSSGAHGRHIFWRHQSFNALSCGSLHQSWVAQKTWWLGSYTRAHHNNESWSCLNLKLSTYQYLYISLVITCLHSHSIRVQFSLEKRPASTNFFYWIILTVFVSTSLAKKIISNILLPERCSSTRWDRSELALCPICSEIYCSPTWSLVLRAGLSNPANRRNLSWQFWLRDIFKL